MDFTRPHRMHHHHHTIKSEISELSQNISSFQKCSLADQTGDLSWYLLQSVITVLNVSAIFANIFFMFICRKAGVMHKNTSAMLATISFCFAVNASAGLFYNIYFFYLGIFGFNEYPVPSNWCSMINSLMVPWDVATCVLMVGVGSERLIATKKHVPSGTISGYVKIIFLFVAFAAIMVTINYTMSLTDQGVCICDGASLAERRSMFVRILTCSIVEAGTISLFGYVHILSRNEADSLGINTAKYCLSQRFQIYETYRTTHMLLPSAVLHAILYLSYLCLLIPIRDLRAHTDLTLNQFNLSTIIFSFPSIHALAHPLICMSRHYYLRNRAFEMVQNKCSPTVVLPNDSHQKDHLTAHKTTPEISSNHSFRSDCARVEYRIAPEKQAELLESFWERQA